MRSWPVCLCAIALFTAAIAAEETAPNNPVVSGPIKIEPLQLDFGSLPVGSSSQPITSTLTNPGNTVVKIVDITASGIDFSETHTCGDSLTAASSCQIQVVFKPATTGSRLGVVSVMTSGQGKPSYIALTGIGQ